MTGQPRLANDFSPSICAAADRLAGALIDRGQYEEALTVCRAILARDDCWERAYRQMMQAYARAGQPPSGLAHLPTLRPDARQQLDVAPSAETSALYAELAH